MRECEYCGLKNASDALYCSGCGTPLVAEELLSAHKPPKKPNFIDAMLASIFGRRLNSTEKGALVLGVGLILGGLYMALYPFEQYITYAGIPRYHMHGTIQHVTKNEQRGIGVCAIFIGAGIVGLALYQGKE
jgi:hypothetical protein